MRRAYLVGGDNLVESMSFDEGTASPSVADPDWWLITKCAASTSMAIAAPAIPAAKLLRSKAFGQKVGSAREAACLLIRIASGGEELERLGPVPASLAGSILGRGPHQGELSMGTSSTCRAVRSSPC
jgi:hypothetical protein